jgi:hypothetical protein
MDMIWSSEKNTPKMTCMENWKNNLVPALFALAGGLAFVPAVMKPIFKGEPLDRIWLAIGMMFFVLAVGQFAIGRKSGGGSGPPGA